MVEQYSQNLPAVVLNVLCYDAFAVHDFLGNRPDRRNDRLLAAL